MEVLLLFGIWVIMALKDVADERRHKELITELRRVHDREGI